MSDLPTGGPGLCAFPLTPVTRDGVDEGALVALVSRLAAGGVDSVGVLGSTGVYPYLSRGERRAAVEAAVDAAGAVPVIAGVGALRTRDTLVHARDAQAAGASALLLAPVSYHRLRDEEVAGLYADVAAESSVPIVLYDNPSTTAFAFSDELSARIAALPLVTGVKVPPPPAGTAADRLARLRRALPTDVSVGISGDWAAAEALLAGYDAWYSAFAGLFPRAARAVVQAATAGDADTADGLSSSLEPIWTLFRRHGSLRVLAAAAQVLGLVDGPCLPRPLLGLEGTERAEVEAALGASGLTV
ncbi:dihydrodipicolinate synthase family protein [Cellulomonas aerilata]|uniref:Dihydrodipicolinate synthase family protein n=1 Tax=Cellulomonas aerilata TaxID=515326 RepID=A0A512DCA0_9CELL|nr:dihydrodipicolinate synthase family protein [Cellulomonas aerilata]GEO34111.1 dihydrodipicolinate synthase family protein [Cellulomonas aerilata]